MKKILNILVLIVILIMIANKGFSKDKYNDKYVIVMLWENRGEMATPSVYDFGGIETITEGKIEYERVKYLTRKECKKLANQIMKEEEDNLKEIKKEKTAIGWQNMRADKYYVTQPDPENIFNYFCIPAELWNKIKPRFKKGDDVYNKYTDDLLKEQKSFFKIMSQCGLTDFGFFHVNVHNTPFICDKYNEKNPVPFKTYEEIIEETK